MKTETKFYKSANFDSRCNIHFVLRVDDLKKVKNWTDKEFADSISMLEKCRADIDRQIKHMNEVRELRDKQLK